MNERDAELLARWCDLIVRLGERGAITSEEVAALVAQAVAAVTA